MLLIRIPGLGFEYFCWDEHDYIAHNIHNKIVLATFQVPYSNKWPLGHLLVYALTIPFDPFQISSYRIATALIDGTTSFLLTFILWKKFCVGYPLSFVFGIFSSIAITACLRSSMGIIVESAANLFLVSGLACLLLVGSKHLRMFLAVGFFCLACWTKPTAFFPALGMVLADFAEKFRQDKGRFEIFVI
jgi:hypothetical protein